MQQRKPRLLLGSKGVKEETIPACFLRLASRKNVPPPRVSAVIPWEKSLRLGKKGPAARKGARAREARDHKSSYKGSQDGASGSGHSDMDGRPSVGTWRRCLEYLQILKEITGKDDEELEWLADAKNGRGFQKSEERRQSAETVHHRLLFEESMQQAGLRLLQDRRLEVSLRTLSSIEPELKRLSELLEELNIQEIALLKMEEEADGEAEAVSFERRQQLTRLHEDKENAETAFFRVLDDIDKGKADVRYVREALTQVAAAVACANGDGDGDGDDNDDGNGDGDGDGDGNDDGNGDGDVGDALATVIEVTLGVCFSRVLTTPARATSGLRKLEHAAASLRERMERTRGDAEAAFALIRKWKERQEALPEYGEKVAQKERAWFAREEEANDQALRRMRALCPVGIMSLTVQGLEQQAKEAGSLYPRQLSRRLKENRLLHWTVEHPTDIARSSFLRGDHAHFFTNLDRYDLVELRAVTACLPERFEVDRDGRKAAWRTAFLQRVQGLVAQERGETVSGVWDPKIGARRVVRLPALTAEQTRRPEYFWVTRQQRGLLMPKQEQQGKRQEGDGQAAGEVEGPFDPDPELRSRFGDHEATGAGMTAELPSGRNHGRAWNGRVARVGATSGRFRALAPIFEGAVATGMPTGSP